MEDLPEIDWRTYLPFIIGILGGMLLGFGIGALVTYNMASVNAWSEFQTYMGSLPQAEQYIPAFPGKFGGMMNVTNFSFD
jgi:hypothetical protein